MIRTPDRFCLRSFFFFPPSLGIIDFLSLLSNYVYGFVLKCRPFGLHERFHLTGALLIALVAQRGVDLVTAGDGVGVDLQSVTPGH